MGPAGPDGQSLDVDALGGPGGIVAYVTGIVAERVLGLPKLR